MIRRLIRGSLGRGMSGLGLTSVMERLSVLRIIKPPQRDFDFAVLSVLKDEMFFLPAFLEHYRDAGVTQFVFLDDRSTDGSLEYLMEQPDCAVVGADETFGQVVEGKKRAVILWRTALAQQFALNKWALVVDLDEFLVLPPGYADMPALVAELDRHGHNVIGAIMIDFYPEDISCLLDASRPANKRELFSRYPYFDDCYHGHWVGGRFERAYCGATERLFERYGVTLEANKPSARTKAEAGMASKFLSRLRAEQRKFELVIHKVPLVRWNSMREYSSSHNLNIPPDEGLQLPLVHFKFTGSLSAKVRSAVTSGAYSMKSAKYRTLDELLARMMAMDGTFLCKKSRKYSESKDFLRSGILRIDGLK